MRTDWFFRNEEHDIYISCFWLWTSYQYLQVPLDQNFVLFCQLVFVHFAHPMSQAISAPMLCCYTFSGSSGNLQICLIPLHSISTCPKSRLQDRKMLNGFNNKTTIHNWGRWGSYNVQDRYCIASYKKLGNDLNKKLFKKNFVRVTLKTSLFQNLLKFFQYHLQMCPVIKILLA